jgi:hypothetical protein
MVAKEVAQVAEAPTDHSQRNLLWIRAAEVATVTMVQAVVVLFEFNWKVH